MAITFVISQVASNCHMAAKGRVQASMWVAAVPMQVLGGLDADVGDGRDGPMVTRVTGVIKSALVVVQASGAAASRKRTKPAQTSAQASDFHWGWRQRHAECDLGKTGRGAPTRQNATSRRS